MSAVYPRLTAQRVMAVYFSPSWRRGVDGDEVRMFVHRVADEIDLLTRELATAREENARLKAALRDWQTRHLRTPR